MMNDEQQDDNETIDNKMMKQQKMMKWWSDERQWNSKVMKDFEQDMMNNKIQQILKTI